MFEVILGVSNYFCLSWARVSILFLDICCLLWILVTVSSLVESASEGLWVAERNTDGLGVKAERGWGKQQGNPVYTRGWGPQRVWGAPSSRLLQTECKTGEVIIEEWASLAWVPARCRSLVERVSRLSSWHKGIKMSQKGRLRGLRERAKLGVYQEMPSPGN